MNTFTCLTFVDRHVVADASAFVVQVTASSADWEARNGSLQAEKERLLRSYRSLRTSLNSLRHDAAGDLRRLCLARYGARVGWWGMGETRVFVYDIFLGGSS